jgi:hypothetical protein
MDTDKIKDKEIGIGELTSFDHLIDTEDNKRALLEDLLAEHDIFIADTKDLFVINKKYFIGTFGFKYDNNKFLVNIRYSVTKNKVSIDILPIKKMFEKDYLDSFVYFYNLYKEICNRIQKCE